MTTYNTGNPLGSVDVKDLYDNAENLDDAVNSLAPTWVDRFGRTRSTMQGVITDAVTASELAANDGASKIGYQPAGTGAVPTDVQSKLRESVSVKDFDAVGDGSNETLKLQAAIDHAAATGRPLSIPKQSGSAYVLGAATSTYCLNLPSNLTVYIDPGVVIRAASGIGVSVRLIQAISASNIYIEGYGATIEGIKSEYVSGEDRHGIRLQDTTNFTLKGITVKDTGGDGVYVGSVCENVLLEDVICDNNRRNNITIIGGKRVTLRRCRMTNADGTSPEAGLDIEPNSNSDFMEDILVENCYSAGNDGGGYVIAPNTLPGAAAKSIKVSVIDCVDDGSAVGFTVNKVFRNSFALSGQIVFERCLARNTAQSGFSIRNYDSSSVPVHLIDCTVVDCSAVVTSARYNAPFSVWSETTDTGATTVGNVHIIRPRIKFTGALPNVVDFHFRALGSGQNITNCHVVDPVEVGRPGAANFQNQANFTGATNCSFLDPREFYTHVGTETLQEFYFGTHYKNDPSVAATFTLGARPVGYPDLTFEVTSSFGVTLTPDGSSSVLPIGTAGQSIRSTQAGASIVLRRISSTAWRVVRQVGTWSVV